MLSPLGHLNTAFSKRHTQVTAPIAGQQRRFYFCMEPPELVENFFFFLLSLSRRKLPRPADTFMAETQSILLLGNKDMGIVAWSVWIVQPLPISLHIWGRQQS